MEWTEQHGLGCGVLDMNARNNLDWTALGGIGLNSTGLDWTVFLG